ncbi:hypothetical protein [Streptomyces profundus]|uniref:DUF7848 domain-containing protein n=1 Tax=Streptomyces profundus TaxID=2867410 RepID=UPI001D15FD47|nr:hypothetical protein [Streptomyces sp. MA3_2.13]UED85697.1 hypothetical protein K4G22_17080 [Streptomyces sp. MA3_2.13]
MNEWVHPPARSPLIRSADWVLSEERGAGAPQAIYGAECMTCGDRSTLADNDAQPVAVWCIFHTQQDPDHDLFLVRAEKHWRVHPRDDEGDDENADGTPAPHPIAAFFDKAFGPSFVGLMCLLTALTGYLLALN